MTDRELLELAAKAAGYDDINHDASGLYRVIGEHEDGTLCMVQFNPLTDDGDALRLAVKLQMLIDPCNSYVTTCSAIGGFAEAHEDTCDDPRAAVRRAIVRAAAAIGEKL